MEELKSEKLSSIKVSQNAKKEYSYEVKIYFDDVLYSDGTKEEESVILRIDNIYKDLHSRFK